MNFLSFSISFFHSCGAHLVIHQLCLSRSFHSVPFYGCDIMLKERYNVLPIGIRLHATSVFVLMTLRRTAYVSMHFAQVKFCRRAIVWNATINKLDLNISSSFILVLFLFFFFRFVCASHIIFIWYAFAVSAVLCLSFLAIAAAFYSISVFFLCHHASGFSRNELVIKGNFSYFSALSLYFCRCQHISPETPAHIQWSHI